jgi:hypothetical protein
MKRGLVLSVVLAGCAGTPASVGPVVGTPRPAILDSEVGDPTAGEIEVRPLDWSLNVMRAPAYLGSTHDGEEIRRTLRGELGALLHCYHDARRQAPDLTGVVHMRFAVDTYGHVRKPHAYGLTLLMASCVREVVRSTQFRRPNGAGIEVNVRFPFAATAELGRAAYPFREPYN